MVYKSFEELPLTLSIEQVASVLSISRSQAYQLAHKEGFPAIRVGVKRIICPKDMLYDWLQRCAEENLQDSEML